MATALRGDFIGVVDYVVFALMLLLSAATGFFYANKDRNENNMDNFHRGKRKINPLAVSLSLSVTIISAVTINGVPAEVYTYGTMIIWETLGMLLATGVAAHIFLPIFYRMDKISIFEYLQIRFGKVPRMLVSLFFLINTFIVISFALYAPCLAFEAMTGVSIWIVMAVAEFVCMLYTLLGGMKAVVWADSLQFFIMVAGMFCMLVEGSKAVGGFGEAWKISNEHKRIDFFNFSFDPRTRHSVWTLAVGYLVTWSSAFAVNQATVQRACSLSSLRVAQIAEWASFPGLFLIIFLAILNGVVMFAYFHTCDPVTIGRVVKKDQLFPLMIVDVIGDIPGLPGLLLASLFSGALSSISSGLNAISAVFIEDFLVPFARKPLSDRSQLLVSKISVVGIAIISFGIAGGVSRLGGLVHQLISTTASLFGGPLLGFFISGTMLPWTNTFGICVGSLFSLAFSGWLLFGSLINIPLPPSLPLSTEGCMASRNASLYLNITQTTIATTTAITQTQVEYTAVEEFYRMSYLWFTAFGMAIFVIVALIVSFITGPTNPKDVDSKLMCPFFYNLCPFLPEKYRKVLLFGVDYDNEKDKDDKLNKLKTVCNEYSKNTVSFENEKNPRFTIYM